MNLPLDRSIRVLRERDSAAGENLLCSFAPVPKVVLISGYLILAVSFGRADAGGALWFGAIPYLTAFLCGIPVFRLFRRAVPALPFVLCAGIANCFFDRTGEGLSALLVLIFKTLGTVGSVMLLMESTSVTELSGALAVLRVPCVLIVQFQLLYRYLVLVMEEARSMRNAYFLRNPGRRMIPFGEWGVLAGRLFLRTVKRGESVWRAMQCRLYDGRTPVGKSGRGSAMEWIFCFALILLLIGLRAAL